MSPTLSKSHFSLLCFFTLTLIVQSKPNLYPSDHKALLLVLKDLNIPRGPDKDPCNFNGVFCEPRILNHSSVLRITRLVFESQHIKGKLSPAISQLSELQQLSVQNNHFFGQIPAQIVDCRKIQILNLGRNQFSGKIPSGFSSLVNLRVLDLSSNKFVGDLKFLKYFPNLEKLNLADNKFAGKVPVSIKSFQNLRFFNFSGNSLLEGQIPFLNQIEDLTENESVPKRYIFAENSNAEAPSSSLDSNNSAQYPITAQPNEHKSNRKKILGWVFGFLAGALAGTLCGFIFHFLFKLLKYLIKGRTKENTLTIFSSFIKKPEDLAFLEKEDGLSMLDVIGKGGCGEVYKAVLPGSNGKEIAVKKIIRPSNSRDAEEFTGEDSKVLDKKMRQIRSEIQTVGQIRHKNLLPLLAHLPRPECHYLVYEYMKNGSLQDWLYHVSQDKRELDWLTRYKLALGVASGLEYLHMSHTPRIIHRDLKPANILLDDDMEARIADFGLAKAVPDAHTHVTTSNVAGTIGYIAPEYYQTFKFTDKCDVYSFGVVLGVLVIGKLPSDNFFQHTDEMSLVKWMRNMMTSEDPKKAIDPKMLGNGYEEQMLLVLKVACFCTLDNPKERPNSKDARCMLAQIKH